MEIMTSFVNAPFSNFLVSFSMTILNAMFNLWMASRVSFPIFDFDLIKKMFFFRSYFKEKLNTLFSLTSNPNYIQIVYQNYFRCQIIALSRL